MTSSGSIKVITDHWPIVLHVSEGAPTDEQLDAYVREATAVLLRGEPHVVVMDASRLTNISAYSRARKKDWIAEHAEQLRATCRGTAVVLSSPVHRLISSMIMLIRPFPTPYFVCETLEEAMAWARERLETRDRES